MFWIKHGRAVYWNEVAAQAMAYRELRELGSSVRVSAVFYGCQNRRRVIIVMEYVPGKTVGQLLKDINQADKEDILNKVALSLSELHRIPIAPGARPAAIDGDKIRHKFFDEQEAPRHYENVDQLEEHLNLVGSINVPNLEYLHHALPFAKCALMS